MHHSMTSHDPTAAVPSVSHKAKIVVHLSAAMVHVLASVSNAGFTATLMRLYALKANVLISPT